MKYKNKTKQIPSTFKEVFLLTMRSDWALESDQGPNHDLPHTMPRSAWSGMEQLYPRLHLPPQATPDTK